jgi:hypothetical protein
MDASNGLLLTDNFTAPFLQEITHSLSSYFSGACRNNKRKNIPARHVWLRRLYYLKSNAHTLDDARDLHLCAITTCLIRDRECLIRKRDFTLIEQYNRNYTTTILSHSIINFQLIPTFTKHIGTIEKLKIE